MLTSKMRTQWLSPAGLLIIWHLNIVIVILDLLNTVKLNIVKLNIVITQHSHTHHSHTQHSHTQT